MKETRGIMGMPIEIEIPSAAQSALDTVFDYFTAVDERFSTYKPESEIMRINRGELAEQEWSQAMREIFALSEETKKETKGFFSILRNDGTIDPSGLVKGWAIRNAARIAEMMGYSDYFLNVGGDIASKGLSSEGKEWRVGIRNPFDTSTIVKVVKPRGRGVATSGNYLRGDHIYDPHEPKKILKDVSSITVIGPDIYEADRFATAAFAMGAEGIQFIESRPGLEGYSIDARGIATMTSGFEQFIA